MVSCLPDHATLVPIAHDELDIGVKIGHSGMENHVDQHLEMEDGKSIRVRKRLRAPGKRMHASHPTFARGNQTMREKMAAAAGTG
eukprot:COSAG05_NODE_17483_length_324_cov_1.151111_2_plen_84_part_01